MHLIYIILTLCLNYVDSSLRVNDPCELPDRGKGICTHMEKCAYAEDLLKRKITPILCGFEDQRAVVCCKRETSGAPGLDGVQFVAGGKPANLGEFPHMVALGYGDKNDIQWHCGGTLITEKFVLTAAHCVSGAGGGPSYVRVGVVNLTSNKYDDKIDYKVIRTIPHPSYKPPVKYHDIALLKLDPQVNLTGKFIPVYLHYSEKIDEGTNLTATGWGKTGFTEDSSEVLMKVDLEYVPHEKCVELFGNAPKKALPNGIIDDYQVCAGNRKGQDTCPGDSGGPLAKGKNIIGITSFGKACAISGKPSIYTRVSYYLSWIDKVILSHYE